jgi:antagonist of mitotic exit network protein 1
MPNLSVLELRACEQITDMRPIVQFKRYRELQGHPPLIEGCEVIELRMKEAEWLLEVEASRRIIADCLEWIYSADSDVDNAEYRHTPASIAVVS